MGEDKGKVRKFIFSKDSEHLLLQNVRQQDAHRTPHDRNGDAFGQVSETLIKCMFSCFCSRYQKPTMKNVRDRLRSMLVDRWKGNRCNINSSGIQEVVGPVEQLSDEFFSEVDDWEEDNCRKKREQCRKKLELFISVTSFKTV